jgi:hypothetical protein
LSPMPFILVMDPLQKMLQIATEGCLQQIQHQACRFHISVYVDDAALYLNPTNEEVQCAKEMLMQFGAVSGLINSEYEQMCGIPYQL